MAATASGHSCDTFVHNFMIVSMCTERREYSTIGTQKHMLVSGASRFSEVSPNSDRFRTWTVNEHVRSEAATNAR